MFNTVSIYEIRHFEAFFKFLLQLTYQLPLQESFLYPRQKLVEHQTCAEGPGFIGDVPHGGFALRRGATFDLQQQTHDFILVHFLLALDVQWEMSRWQDSWHRRSNWIRMRIWRTRKIWRTTIFWISGRIWMTRIWWELPPPWPWRNKSQEPNVI